MSRSKSHYPERPMRPRPKKPGKGKNKPSSHSGGRKSKTWLSLREKVSQNMDAGVRVGFSWWKSPMMKEARLRKKEK